MGGEGREQLEQRLVQGIGGAVELRLEGLEQGEGEPAAARELDVLEPALCDRLEPEQRPLLHTQEHGERAARHGTVRQQQRHAPGCRAGTTARAGGSR